MCGGFCRLCCSWQVNGSRRKEYAKELAPYPLKVSATSEGFSWVFFLGGGGMCGCTLFRGQQRYLVIKNLRASGAQRDLRLCTGYKREVGAASARSTPRGLLPTPCRYVCLYLAWESAITSLPGRTLYYISHGFLFTRGGWQHVQRSQVSNHLLLRCAVLRFALRAGCASEQAPPPSRVQRPRCG
jgi:hypothetical protein